MKAFQATLLLQSLLFYSVSAVDTGDGQCSLSCLNSAPCKQGEADYGAHPTANDGSPFPFHEATSREGWFCECPDDWTGIRCGREVEVCDYETLHFCYHGGKCLQAGDLAHEKMFCDCSDAEHAGIPYVGKYCELKAEMCDADDADAKDAYCVNGGTCKDNFTEAIRPCDCPAGYHGHHCEFDRNETPECDLNCMGHGECQLGSKSYDSPIYDDYWNEHEGFMSCDCEEGYYGPKCGIQGELCGEYHCFHGSKCVETLDKSGDSAFRCDCEDANIPGETSFGGVHCQAESTSFCASELGPNGRLFCANGGTCKSESNNGHAGCDCLPGWDGPICEFRNEGDGLDNLHGQCSSITCQNGGLCRLGFKEMSFNEKFGPELDHFDYNMTHDENWEHCVCPDDYFGIQCEHKIQICEGGDHICLHGSECVSMANFDDAKAPLLGDKAHECDCGKGFDENNRHAGKFCQYSSTDICTKHDKPGAGKASFAFCVNDGRCLDKVNDNEEHPGCDCPDGFEGDHCEYLEGRSPKSAPVSPPTADVDTKRSANGGDRGNAKSSSGGLVAGLVVGIAVVAVIAGLIVKSKIQRQRSDMAKSVAATNLDGSNDVPPIADNLDAVNHGDFTSTSSVDDLEPSIYGTENSSSFGDNDGPNLQNIEIL